MVLIIQMQHLSMPHLTSLQEGTMSPQNSMDRKWIVKIPLQSLEQKGQEATPDCCCPPSTCREEIAVKEMRAKSFGTVWQQGKATQMWKCLSEREQAAAQTSSISWNEPHLHFWAKKTQSSSFSGRTVGSHAEGYRWMSVGKVALYKTLPCPALHCFLESIQWSHRAAGFKQRKWNISYPHL